MAAEQEENRYAKGERVVITRTNEWAAAGAHGTVLEDRNDGWYDVRVDTTNVILRLHRHDLAPVPEKNAEPAASVDRLLSAAARALERVQVCDCSCGAADEAEAILSEVVTLDGRYVP